MILARCKGIYETLPISDEIRKLNLNNRNL